MKKWYSAILREIRKLGDRIFVIDEYGLLKDPNFFKELRDRYYMHEYVNDAAFFKMYHSNSDCPMLVYSRKPVSRDFINR